MQSMLGSEWSDFEQSLEQAPPVSLHFNHLKANQNQLFSGENIPWNPTGIYLDDRPVFTLDPNFHAGRYYVQEAGSMLLVPILQQIQQASDRSFRAALDLCAAPGGKTTLLLNYLPEDCLVVANEVIRNRFTILRENLLKWGRANTISTQADPEKFAPLAGLFDMILVDAPCSGEGLFRKHQKARVEWSPDHVQFCASRQRRILHETLDLVREGGFLVYSTCTYNPLENDDNVEWICSQGGFEVFSLSLPESWGVVNTPSGYQCFPHRSRSEGFYVSVLRKTGSSRRPGKVPPLRYFSKVNKIAEKVASSWLSPKVEWQLLCNPKGGLYFLDQKHLEILARLSQNVPRIVPGTPLGMIKGRDLVPAHALALSIHKAESIESVAVNQDLALAFLRKQELNGRLAESGTGWRLISYNGYGIGWVKMLPNRINNYLPKQYRIRID